MPYAETTAVPVERSKAEIYPPHPIRHIVCLQ